MKRLIILLIATIAMWHNVFAYDFSAVSPSGHRLYYTRNGNTVSVSGGTQPERINLTGDLIIPDSVAQPGIYSTYYTVVSIDNEAFCFSNITSVAIPGSVTSIGYDAFVGCDFDSVIIPNSVTAIGYGAFQSCTNLTSITIPHAVTAISSLTFYNCSALTSVTIPHTVTRIRERAFEGCNSLTDVNYKGNITQWCNITFDDEESNPIYYAHSLSINGNPVIDLNIPGEVTEIKQDAFINFSNLRSVVIGNSVTKIGDRAFCECTGLTSVIIGESVVTIRYSAFYNCGGIISVTIPETTRYIYDNAFYNVRHIEYHGTAEGAPFGAISMNGIIDGDYVYADTTKSNLLAYLGNGGVVSIPPMVNIIGDKAFYNCALTSIIIPNSVTSIGNYTFQNCSGLTSVTIPDSVTSIGEWAFNNCNGLTSVTIPDNVTYIGQDAFSVCTNLISVILGNNNFTVTSVS